MLHADKKQSKTRACVIDLCSCDGVKISRFGNITGFSPSVCVQDFKLKIMHCYFRLMSAQTEFIEVTVL